MCFALKENLTEKIIILDSTVGFKSELLQCYTDNEITH